MEKISNIKTFIILCSLYCNGQQFDTVKLSKRKGHQEIAPIPCAFTGLQFDSIKTPRGKSHQLFEINYQLWLVKQDSLRFDLLSKYYYSDFRADSRGYLGLRINYYKAGNIPFFGLSKERILKYLGEPDDTNTMISKEDSLQHTIFEYEMGSDTSNESSNSGNWHYLQIDLVNNRAIYDSFIYGAGSWKTSGPRTRILNSNNNARFYRPQ